jgi:hypothetical protein
MDAATHKQNNPEGHMKGRNSAVKHARLSINSAADHFEQQLIYATNRIKLLCS